MVRILSLFLLLASSLWAQQSGTTNEAQKEPATERGKFKYNTNHFPIENFYLLRIGKDSDGTFVRKIQKVVFADHADAYVGECKMK